MSPKENTKKNSTSGPELWIRAMRAPFFTAAVVPVVLGTAFAWYAADIFMWGRFILTMAGAVLAHAGTNLANDYWDHISGCDASGLSPKTPFSGGSRVIQEGLIAPRTIFAASSAAFVLCGAIGLYLNHLCEGNVVLMIGIAGVFLGVFYTARPLKIAYTGFGELAVGIGFGPLIVMGAYYVQAGTLPLDAFLISVPVGILIAMVLYINEFPDLASDVSVGKRTLVVVLGKARAVVLYHVFLGVSYIWVVLLVASGRVPLLCLIVFFSLPLALRAFTVSRKNFDKIGELLPANAATIALHLTFGILLSLGFVLGKIFAGK